MYLLIDDNIKIQCKNDKADIMRVLKEHKVLPKQAQSFSINLNYIVYKKNKVASIWKNPKKSKPKKNIIRGRASKLKNTFIDGIIAIDDEFLPKPYSKEKHKIWIKKLHNFAYYHRNLLIETYELATCRKELTNIAAKIKNLNVIDPKFTHDLIILSKKFPKETQILKTFSFQQLSTLESHIKKGTNSPQYRFITEHFSGPFIEIFLTKLNYRHPALRYTQLTKQQTIELNNKIAQNDETRLTKQKTIDINSIIGTAQAILDNQDKFDEFELFAALAAVTGRRASEILVTGSFEPIQQNNMKEIFGVDITKGHCLFAGQLKKRDTRLPEDTKSTDDVIHVKYKPYIIPVYSDLEKINQAIETIRKKTGLKEYKEINGSKAACQLVNSRYAHNYNNAVKNIFPIHYAIKQNLDAKSMRTLYRKYSFETNKPNVDDIVYGREILGHDQMDFKSQQKYKGIILEYKPYDPSSFIRKRSLEINKKSREDDKFERLANHIETNFKNDILSASTRKGTEESLEKIYNTIHNIILNEKFIPSHHLVYKRLENTVSKGLCLKAWEAAKKAWD